MDGTFVSSTKLPDNKPDGPGRETPASTLGWLAINHEIAPAGAESAPKIDHHTLVITMSVRLSSWPMTTTYILAVGRL